MFSSPLSLFPFLPFSLSDRRYYEFGTTNYAKVINTAKAALAVLGRGIKEEIIKGKGLFSSWKELFILQ